MTHRLDVSGKAPARGADHGLRPNKLSYWRKTLEVQNFGDFLSEFLFAEFTRAAPSDPAGGRERGDYEFIYLIGSVISDAHIRKSLEHAKESREPRIAFWGCGKRDEADLDPELVRRCDFLGVRGPLTRDALGLSPETPLGDPALLLPALYRPRAAGPRAEVLCVPHFLERRADEDLLRQTGADAVLRPNIPADFAALFAFLDRLTNARFVLAGALHAAIVSCAYGVPFCYFDSGYIDVPFKWRDFAASVGIEANFATTLAEGEDLYARGVAGRLRLPDIGRIARCGPFAPPRRVLRRLTAPAV